MNRRVLLAGMALSILVLAYLLRDVVEQLIILPLAYVWWILRVYYSMFPQFVLWVVLAGVVVYSAVKSLMPEVKPRSAFKIPHKPLQGQIHGLVEWLHKTQRGGNYFKWLVANRLGKAAREILSQRGGQSLNRKFEPLDGRDWNPPQKIRDYLEAGLNGSFTDYPQPRRWKKTKSTPLDLDPQQVIEYLEDEMETSHDRDRKGI